MVPQSRHTGGGVRAARPRLDEDWLYRTGQNLPVGCLSGKHSALDKFQGKHAKSTTAKSTPGGTTWPVVGGIGRVWVLPFRHSPVAVGCQCFLLRQEHFVRNMGCHVFFYRLDAGVQGRAENMRYTVHRIQCLCDHALPFKAPCRLPPRILFGQWVVNWNGDSDGDPFGWQARKPEGVRTARTGSRPEPWPEAEENRPGCNRRWKSVETLMGDSPWRDDPLDKFS